MRRETNIDAEYVRIKIQELTKRAIQVGTFLYYSWTVCRISTGVSTKSSYLIVLRFLQIKTSDLCPLTRDIFSFAGDIRPREGAVTASNRSSN